MAADTYTRVLVGNIMHLTRPGPITNPFSSYNGFRFTCIASTTPHTGKIRDGADQRHLLSHENTYA